MSYARFSDESNVYVFPHAGGYVQCCGCSLDDVWNYHSAPEVVAHMQAHVEAGHKVPEYLLDPTLYEDGDFVAMCDIFMCHKQTGHEGEHTPLSGRFENGEQIRARQIAGVK